MKLNFTQYIYSQVDVVEVQLTAILTVVVVLIHT